jgi:Flp pilus assembly protein TadB
MRDVQVRDLLELTALDVDNPDEKLTQLYLWMYDYSMTGAKALTAFGASLLIGLVVAVIEEKSTHAIGSYVVVGFIGAGLTIVVGALRYARIRKLSKQFMDAHYLLAELARVRPFLLLYRNRQQ